MILSYIFFIAKLSRGQYLKLVHCAYTELTEQAEPQQTTFILNISSSIVKLVKSHPYFHSDHDSDSNSNISSYPQTQRLCAEWAEKIFAWTSMIAAVKLMVAYAEEVSQLLMGNCQVWHEMEAGWMMKMVLADVWYQNFFFFLRQYDKVVCWWHPAATGGR